MVAGRLNVKEGNEDEAIKAFETAHKLNPKVVKPVLELQDLYVKRGNLEKAKSIVQSAIKHRPKNHVYQSRLGKIWQKLGEENKAYEAIELVRQFAPNNTHAGNAAIQLALLKINQSSDSEVIHQLHHFIELYPEHTGLRINLIRFLINHEFYTDALVEIELLHEIAPDEIRAKVDKAIIYQKQGFLEKAEVLCNAILEKKPNLLNGLLLKADLLSHRGETKEAYYLFQRAVEIHPSSASAYARFAQFLFLEGHVEQSLSILENGISNSKHIENLWYKSI